MTNPVSGQTVNVLGAPRLVRWARKNLQAHWSRHPGGKDAACWQDLLGKSSQVTEAEYEKRSYQTVENALLIYDQTTDRHGAATTFVDGERVLSVANAVGPTNSVDLRTCFHRHMGGTHNHKRGEHRAKGPVEMVIEYLRVARIEADANVAPLKVRKEPLGP